MRGWSLQGEHWRTTEAVLRFSEQRNIYYSSFHLVLLLESQPSGLRQLSHSLFKYSALWSISINHGLRRKLALQ